MVQFNPFPHCSHYSHNYLARSRLRHRRDEDSDAADDWEDLSDNNIEEDVVEICDEIASAFEDDADIALDAIEITILADAR